MGRRNILCLWNRKHTFNPRYRDIEKIGLSRRETGDRGEEVDFGPWTIAKKDVRR